MSSLDLNVELDATNPITVIAAGRVAANGTAIGNLSNCTVTRTAAGRYTVNLVTPATNANYCVVLTPEIIPQRDDYFMAFGNTQLNSFNVEGTEQDNGTSAGLYIDMGFCFLVYQIG